MIPGFNLIGLYWVDPAVPKSNRKMAQTKTILWTIIPCRPWLVRTMPPSRSRDSQRSRPYKSAREVTVAGCPNQNKIQELNFLKDCWVMILVNLKLRRKLKRRPMQKLVASGTNVRMTPLHLCSRLVPRSRSQSCSRVRPKLLKWIWTARLWVVGAVTFL